MKVFAYFNIIILVLCSQKEYEKLEHTEKIGLIDKFRQKMTLKNQYKKIEPETNDIIQCMTCKKEFDECRCIFEPCENTKE